MNGFQSVVPRPAETPGMLLEMQIKLHPKSTESENLGAEHSNTFSESWGILMHVQNGERPRYTFKV